MNITKEEGENQIAILKVQITEADYKANVEKTLTEYRKQAKINGFRPGKVPMGMIKKMYGHYALIDEVNKLISEALQKYISEEKLDLLGEPLPSEVNQKGINWEEDKDFEFVYDIGLAPAIDIKLTKKNKFDYFKIAATDKMVTEQIENLQNQFGSQRNVTVVEENDVLRGHIAQVDEKGEIVEGGVLKENASILLSTLKDEDSKKLFLGAKINDAIVYNPFNATENEAEVGALLGVDKEDEDKIKADYMFTISEILHFDKAELNQELFDKIFGEGVVHSEEELHAKIKGDTENRFAPNSDYKFLRDFKESQVQKLDVELPEEFLKRWLTTINKDNDQITEEQINTDFPIFLEDLKWQMIKNFFIKSEDIKVETEEIKNASKEFARMQFAQFGMMNPKEEDLENWGNEILRNKEEGKKLYETELDKKIIAAIKEKVALNEKEVSVEEFSKLIEN